MQKWEYMHGTADDAELDSLGKDGWELVSSVFDPREESIIHFFKRPLD